MRRSPIFLAGLVFALLHVACGGAIEGTGSEASPNAGRPPACTLPSPTSTSLRVPDGGNPLQLAVVGGHVLLAVQRASEDHGLILSLQFDEGTVKQIADDYREDYSLVPGDKYLVYFAATGPSPVRKEGPTTIYEMAPGEWMARDPSSGEVRRLGKTSYGSGVSLRDGTFGVVSTGEDGEGPPEIWSWDPVTNRLTTIPTTSFTNGRVPNIRTDGVDLFVEDDDASGEGPLERIWKIDMASRSAVLVHQEAYTHPIDSFFLGVDRETLYFVDQKPPTLRAVSRTGGQGSSIALDIEDGEKSAEGLPPQAVGEMVDDLIFITSPSNQTMVQVDKRSGASLGRAPAATKERIYAYAADACYVYFSSGDVISRVPRLK